MRISVILALGLALQGFGGLTLAEPTATDLMKDLMKKGDKQWEANQLDAAMESYLAAEKADPGSVELLMKKAGLQMMTLHYSDAVETYQKAIGLDPQNAKAFIGMGVSYLHNGAMVLAKAAFEEAIKIEPARKAQLEPALVNIEESLRRMEAVPEHNGNPHGQQDQAHQPAQHP